MSKISRQDVLVAALRLLDEEGIEKLSTRRLASRLGVESPALYWHIRNKADLLAAMASEALADWLSLPISTHPEQWSLWFKENARGFRKALLAHRDGARLHAGTSPSPAELERLSAKISYLVRAGFDRQHALMALYASSQFTLGSVLEEQGRSTQSEADEPGPTSDLVPVWLTRFIHQGVAGGAEAAFEFGLALLTEGLAKQRHSSATSVGE